MHEISKYTGIDRRYDIVTIKILLTKKLCEIRSKNHFNERW